LQRKQKRNPATKGRGQSFPFGPALVRILQSAQPQLPLHLHPSPGGAIVDAAEAGGASEPARAQAAATASDAALAAAAAAPNG